MKKILSISLLVPAVAVLGLSVPAFSGTMDMHIRGEHGHMMDMGNMDKMAEMMGMCLEHANMIGLTDDQIMKIKPIYIQMLKNMPDSRLTRKLQRSN